MSQRAVWVHVGWRESFFWRWFLARTALVSAPALLFFSLNAGVLGLIAFGLAAFPWPVRLVLDSQGVTLTSLLVRERWPAGEIERIRVERDSRRWAWPRRHLLAIERRGRTAVLVFGPLPELTALAQSARLATTNEILRDDG